jgi:hypothetical protein
MSLLDKLLGASKKRAIENKPQLEELLKKKLKGLVYDDELVNELLPVFVKLQGQEGFDVVLELLESKEKQIEVISNGDWFKKEAPTGTNVNTEEEDQDDVENLVDSILNKKYGEK